MGFAEGEENKLVAEGQVMNLVLHCRTIEEGCVSLSVTKSHDNAYELYETVDQGDAPVIKMVKAILYFILWPTEFLRPAGGAT
jgi:hypothetical protein